MKKNVYSTKNKILTRIYSHRTFFVFVKCFVWALFEKKLFQTVKETLVMCVVNQN